MSTIVETPKDYKIVMEITPEKICVLLRDIKNEYDPKLSKMNAKEVQWQKEMDTSITLNQYIADMNNSVGYDEFLGTIGVQKETQKAKRYRKQYEKLKVRLLDLYTAFCELESICIDEGIVEEVKLILSAEK